MDHTRSSIRRETNFDAESKRPGLAGGGIRGDFARADAVRGVVDLCDLLVSARKIPAPTLATLDSVGSTCALVTDSDDASANVVAVLLMRRKVGPCMIARLIFDTVISSNPSTAATLRITKEVCVSRMLRLSSEAKGLLMPE